MELFAKIVDGKKSFTVSVKSSIIDARLGSECFSASFFLITTDILLGKKVSQEKNWENKGISFGKCLVKLLRTNCLYRKKSLQNLLKQENQMIKMFMFTSLLKAEK